MIKIANRELIKDNTQDLIIEIQKEKQKILNQFRGRDDERLKNSLYDLEDKLAIAEKFMKTFL